MSAIKTYSFWVSYPTLRKAALIIAYDNGIINRQEPEAEFLENAMGALCADGVPTSEIAELEAFLATLTEEELSTVCVGFDDEVDAIEARCPNSSVEPSAKLTRLLNDIMEC